MDKKGRGLIKYANDASGRKMRREKIRNSIFYWLKILLISALTFAALMFATAVIVAWCWLP